jgi:hypothetical protein
VDRRFSRRATRAAWSFREEYIGRCGFGGAEGGSIGFQLTKTALTLSVSSPQPWLVFSASFKRATASLMDWESGAANTLALRTSRLPLPMHLSLSAGVVYDQVALVSSRRLVSRQSMSSWAAS